MVIGFDGDLDAVIYFVADPVYLCFRMDEKNVGVTGLTFIGDELDTFLDEEGESLNERHKDTVLIDVHIDIGTDRKDTFWDDLAFFVEAMDIAGM
jgi:hypothetical protein